MSNVSIFINGVWPLYARTIFSWISNQAGVQKDHWHDTGDQPGETGPVKTARRNSPGLL